MKARHENVNLIKIKLRQNNLCNSETFLKSYEYFFDLCQKQSNAVLFVGINSNFSIAVKDALLSPYPRVEQDHQVLEEKRIEALGMPHDAVLVFYHDLFR